MADAMKDLQEKLRDGETIEAIVFGEWDGYEVTPPNPVPPEMIGKLLSAEEAAPMMKGWRLESGYGHPECYAIRVWTDQRILWVTQYDGSTELDYAERNPTAGVPSMPGGG